MNLISIKKLTKIIAKKNNQLTLLNNISLDIKQGEFVGILGESGAGKTTLLNVLCGLDDFTSGEYLFESKKINDLTKEKLSNFRNKELGIVFQEFHLINHYSALKNILLPLDYSKEKKCTIDIENLLKTLNIDAIKNQKTTNLSGGEKQRVAIARALINNPKIIIADEPTGSLDSKNSTQIIEILKNLNTEGKTIVIVTHDPMVAKYCSRIITMKDGRIIMDKIAKVCSQENTNSHIEV